MLLLFPLTAAANVPVGLDKQGQSPAALQRTCCCSYTRVVLLAVSLLSLPPPSAAGSTSEQLLVECSCLYNNGENGTSRAGFRCARNGKFADERKYDRGLRFLTDQLPDLAQQEGTSCQKVHLPSLSPGYQLVHGVGVYKMYTIARGFVASHNTCVKDGATLAVTETADEALAIAKLLERQAWLGFHRHGAFQSDFVSIFGQELASLEPVNWSKPDKVTMEDCVVLRQIDDSSAPVLAVEACSSPQPFLCEVPLEKMPPAGYSLVSDARLLKLYKVSASRKAASITCQHEGAALAVIRTEEQATELQALLRQTPDVLEVYVGLRAKDDRYITDSGESEELLDFRNWDIRETTPPLLEPKRACVSFHRDGYLRAAFCEGPTAFVCEATLKIRP